MTRAGGVGSGLAGFRIESGLSDLPDLAAAAFEPLFGDVLDAREHQVARTRADARSAE